MDSLGHVSGADTGVLLGGWRVEGYAPTTLFAGSLADARVFTVALSSLAVQALTSGSFDAERQCATPCGYKTTCAQPEGQAASCYCPEGTEGDPLVACTPSLVARWALHETTGTTVPEVTGNCNAGYVLLRNEGQAGRWGGGARPRMF